MRIVRSPTADLREGIRVNCVSPGTADTPWVGRLLEKADDTVAYLASPRSGSTTGVSLEVDGGMQNLRLRPQ